MKLLMLDCFKLIILIGQGVIQVIHHVMSTKILTVLGISMEDGEILSMLGAHIHHADADHSIIHL